MSEASDRGTVWGTGERGIFRRTLPAAEQQSDRRMVRALGLGQLTMIGVGAIIGAGIFSLAGEVAREMAGPAVLLSFLIAGAASLCAAFSYAEFAGLVPRAGSSYTYAAAVLGEVVGWVIGWDLLLEYTAIVATVSISMSGYATYLLESVGLDLPAWMAGAPGTGAGHRVDLVAMVICLGVAWLLNRGTRQSARVDVVLTVLKVLVVLLVIGVGIFQVNWGNLVPFAPMGFSGAVTGASTVFFAVFGYDALSTAAEESTDAPRLMPKAMVLSLAIAMVLYAGACIVLTGMVHYTRINPDSGFASAFSSVGMPAVGSVIAVGAILGIVTVCFSFMLGASRLWYALSRDGLMPRWFGELHPRRRVPHRATWILGIVAAVLAGLLPVKEAAQLTNIGILFAFVLVCVAVVVLRYRRPDLPRAFRCPGMPVVPVLGVVFSVWLMTFLNGTTWLRLGGWMVIGLAIYLGWGYRNTRRVNPGGSVDLSSVSEV